MVADDNQPLPELVVVADDRLGELDGREGFRC